MGKCNGLPEINHIINLMRSIYFQLILLLFLGFCQLKTQTSALNVRWDTNPEPDMYQYHLYRAVNNQINFQLLYRITHPDSTYHDQSTITPGNLYAYTLVAVDSAGNQSDFSDTVAVGIPKINWTLTSISNTETTQVRLIDIIEDPDDYFSDITLEFSQLNHIGIDQDNQNIYLFSDPPGYIGPASFNLKATDPDGFYDYKSININFIVLINPGDNPIPLTTILYQNFPNPFNPSTQIRFGISKPGYLSLTLYSILGEKITSLYQGWEWAGYHQIELDCSSLASSIYFVNMQMGEYQKSIKIYLQK